MKSNLIRSIALAACALCGSQATPASTPDSDASAWQQDLDAFLEVLNTEHDNPYFHTPEAEFRQAVAEYRSSLPDIDRSARIAGLARIVALVGDGHTWMPMHRLPFDGLPPGPGFSSLPVRFELFEDGLYIVGASSRHADFVGARVVEIGGDATERAVSQAMRLLPQDATNFARELVAEWLMQIELLRVFGLASETVELTLADGRTLVLAPLPPEAAYDWVRSMDGGPVGRQGWQTAATETPFWLEAFDGPVRVVELDVAVYVQINEIRDPEPGALAGAMAEAVTRAEALPAPAMIIDLRRCLGGDGTLNDAMVKILAESAAINTKGRLVVLTGRSTHSAAVMLVSALERETAAVFVGQPTADRPNHYGETNIFVTPNTGLPIIHASEYYPTGGEGDDRRFRSPDVSVPYTFVDYSNGRDSVLTAALNMISGD